MRNPVTATRSLIERDAPRPPAASSPAPASARFAPLFTRAVELTITTVDDELGRPLVGVFVPDGELL